MLWLLLSTLKRIPPRIGVGAVVVLALAATLMAHARHDRAALADAYTRGSTARGDSISVSAHHVTDSLVGVISVKESALADAEHAAAVARGAVPSVRAAANAATDALYASLAHVSADAKADGTVQALAARSDTLAHATGRLGATLDSVVVTSTVALARAADLHDTDVAALHSVGVITAVVRDSLETETAKPKRTKKAIAVAGAVGYGVLRGIEYVAEHVRKH